MKFLTAIQVLKLLSMTLQELPKTSFLNKVEKKSSSTKNKLINLKHYVRLHMVNCYIIETLINELFTKIKKINEHFTLIVKNAENR